MMDQATDPSEKESRRIAKSDDQGLKKFVFWFLVLEKMDFAILLMESDPALTKPSPRDTIQPDLLANKSPSGSIVVASESIARQENGQENWQGCQTVEPPGP